MFKRISNDDPSSFEKAKVNDETFSIALSHFDIE